MTAPAMAAPSDGPTVAAEDPAHERDEIIVNGAREKSVESPKATRPLLDTPQTITVIGDQTIRKQNLLTLRDALQTIPGITFGAGEGGGGYGDSINLRGYSANNDITIDGVRDSAQYSRSETFNLQQIEVYNGANSVFGGAGSVGGTINLVTKVPQRENLTIVQAGVGTDDYYRATVDSNVRVSDLVAVRLNGVYHRNDVPGRDVEQNKRWAVAPSLTIGVDSPTNLVLQYLHQKDDNIPVYGVPFYVNATYGGPLPGVDDSNYYGIANLDKQDSVVDQATVRFTHAFSDKVSIRNLTRWQRVGQDSTTSAPQGVFCLANNRTPAGAACTASFTSPVLYDGVLRAATTAAPFVVTVQPGFFLGNGPRGFVRNQENQLLYNQTDLRAVFDTAGMEHTLVVGVSLAQEDYRIETGNLLRTATGVSVVAAPINIGDADTTYSGPVNFIRSGQSQGDSSNIAAYLFDTIKIVPQLEASVGLRYEHAKGRFRADTYATTVGATLGTYTRGSDQFSDEKLFSYRFGLNFKPVETVSLYAAYGNSTTPTSATVRLGCGTLVTAPSGSLDPCDVQPEKAVNYEIGAKADLFGRKLQLTAAVFRNDRTNYRVATNDPIVATLPVTDGRSRVDGVALGASGNITKAWSIFANYTYLDGEILQSVSNYCLANPGPRATSPVTNPCGNSAAIPDPQAGQRLNNTPRHSGSLFTTYTLPFGLQIGYGLTYQGSFTLNNSALATPLAPTTALTPIFRTDDYLTHRAFLSYPVTPGLTAQVNVQNLTNTRYFTGIRNNGWAVPGEDRSAVFSLYYSF
ncbi:TonB-dependent receptor [Sphingomonas sp. PB4P5]|uniref:TonB-dependent receptor n=1 Tax=Parasphingomonas puruogangriensis TaxID=3096155 RepID=UPI002FC69B1E